MWYGGYSHADGGKAVTDYIMANYPKGTQIGIIHGPPIKLSFDRAAEDLHIANGVKIVSEEYADFDRAKAYDSAQRMITTNPQMRIIIACSSIMAIRAVEAMDSMGLLGEIDVFGAVAILEELDAVEKGRLKATWLRDPVTIGEKAAEAIMLHMNGREKEIVASYNVPIKIIDSLAAINKYLNLVT